jgi:hypothetical protein
MERCTFGCESSLVELVTFFLEPMRLIRHEGEWRFQRVFAEDGAQRRTDEVDVVVEAAVRAPDWLGTLVEDEPLFVDDDHGKLEYLPFFQLLLGFRGAGLGGGIDTAFKIPVFSKLFRQLGSVMLVKFKIDMPGYFQL